MTPNPSLSRIAMVSGSRRLAADLSRGPSGGRATPEWTTCPQCSLKHGRRQDNLCPRCKQPVADGGVAQHEMGHTQPAADDVADAGDPPLSPWGAVALGLLTLGAAFLLHHIFGELASGKRESVRIWWGIALMYKMLGPKITVAVVGLIGAAVTWSGMRRLSS